MKKIFTLICLLYACQSPQAPDFRNPIDPNITDSDDHPLLRTKHPVDVYATSFKTGGIFIEPFGPNISDKGICWGLSESVSVLGNCTSEEGSFDEFSVEINNLLPDSTYYFRSYATNPVNLYYGNELNVKMPSGTPHISLKNGNLRASTTYIEIELEVVDTRGSIINDLGVCYKKQNEEETCVNTSTKKIEKYGNGYFETFLVEGVDIDSEYQVRWYANRLNLGKIWGSYYNISTLSGKPIVNIFPVSNITPFSALIRAQITSLEGANIVSSGACYIPQITENEEICVSGVLEGEIITVELENLTPEENYLFNLFIETDRDIYHYDGGSFSSYPLYPIIVETTPPFDITPTGFNSGGSIDNMSHHTIVRRGICYTSGGSEPNLSDTCIFSNSTVSTTFSLEVTGLTPEEVYSVKAFVETDKSVFWGNRLWFATPSYNYTLELFASPGTGGTVSGSGVFEEGTHVSISAYPSTGWDFVSWTGDVGYVDDPSSPLSTFIIPDQDVNLTAVFEKYEWPRDTTTEIVDVTNPATGRTWMDRNLGASRAATSPNDELAYGDLYQWGRASDGHENRYSAVTSEGSTSDQPGHPMFIWRSEWHKDWRTPPNSGLWAGVDGLNNPCPEGYRVPTNSDWWEEMESWVDDGPFPSVLKLTSAGSRRPHISGGGEYWSQSTNAVEESNFLKLGYYPGVYNGTRHTGRSVRCIKN